MNESRERIRRERERDKNTYTSPRQALRRVLLLSEGRQFREAAAILARLSPAVLQSVAEELPIDLIVEALPHSAHLLETLLGRLSTLERSAHVGGACEAAAWRLVRLAGADTRPGCARLVRELTTYRPQLREMLAARRRQLDAAVHGLGTHGLTADSSGALVSLHAALRTELQRHVDVYKAALHKLDELSPVTVTQAPAASSHQRLLSLSQADIERRLIDNKSLLTVVEKPSLRQLPSLVAALAARVESDKEVLSCIGQIKRLDPAFDAADTRPAAGIMMSYSRGCSGVLALMPPASTPPRSPPASSACSDGYHSDSEHEVDAARNYLVSRYGQLFAKAHKETMEALGALDPLQHAHQLKSKIVFSVVVLSFRACSGLRERRLGEALAVLGVGEGAPTAVRARLLAASADALAHTVDTFPLGDAERLVANQVLQTLHEYPCLETCVALFQYIASACRVAWTLCNQQPAMTIDTDFTPVLMRPEKHVRFVSSDQRSDLIRSFIWPALMDGPRCVYKAVVTT